MCRRWVLVAALVATATLAGCGGAPPAGSSPTIVLTGYRHLSLAGPSSGPVAVVVRGGPATKLLQAIAALPTIPEPHCMEDVTLFTIQVRGAGRWGVRSADGHGCVAGVRVTAPGGATQWRSDRGCPLGRLVAADLPAGRAAATRASLHSCP